MVFPGGRGLGLPNPSKGVLSGGGALGDTAEVLGEEERGPLVPILVPLAGDWRLPPGGASSFRVFVDCVRFEDVAVDLLLPVLDFRRLLMFFVFFSESEEDRAAIGGCSPLSESRWRPFVAALLPEIRGGIGRGYFGKSPSLPNNTFCCSVGTALHSRHNVGDVYEIRRTCSNSAPTSVRPLLYLSWVLASDESIRNHNSGSMPNIFPAN